MPRRTLLGALLGAIGLSGLAGCSTAAAWVGTWDADLSPDGASFFASLEAGIGVWDAATGRHTRTLTLAPGWMRRWAIIPDGRRLALATSDARVRLVDSATGATQSEFATGHQLGDVIDGDRGISAMKWSPDGRVLASAAQDASVRIWSASGTPLETLPLETGSWTALAFSPDGSRLAAATTGRAAMLWDTGSWAPVRSLNESPAPGYGAAFSPDSRLLATTNGASDGGVPDAIHLFDARTGEVRATTSRSAHDVTFSRDGHVIAFSSPTSKTLGLWSPDDGSVRTLSGHRDRPYRVRFSLDGSTLYSVSAREGILVWDVATARLRRRFDLP